MVNHRLTVSLLVSLVICACQPQDQAKELVKEAIKAHGGAAYNNKRIDFDFRNYHLVLEHRNGQFRYQRTYRDSTGNQLIETLTNNGFWRTLNGKRQTLDSAQTQRYSRAVNSVAYFVLLPAKLSDPAVLADYVGESKIDGQPYHKVRVRFRAEGGGADYQDTFFTGLISRRTRWIIWLTARAGLVFARPSTRR